MKIKIVLTLICFSCLAAGCSTLSVGPLSVEDQQVNEIKQDVENQLNLVLTASFTATAEAYTTPESSAPPTGPYPYPPIDIVKVSLGTTSSDLYLKLEFSGTIPHDQETVFNNKILSTNTAICLDTDQNPNTGCSSNYGAEVQLVIDARQGVSPFQSAVYFSSPTGIEEPEPSRYANKGNGNIILGGIGYNFVAAKFPLPVLGIQRGQTIDITMWAEAESDQWHHFSFKRLPKQTVTL